MPKDERKARVSPEILEAHELDKFFGLTEDTYSLVNLHMMHAYLVSEPEWEKKH